MWLRGYLHTKCQGGIEAALRGLSRRSSPGPAHRGFRYGQLDRDELHQRVSRAVAGFKVSHIHLGDQRVEVTGDTGQISFDFRVDAEKDSFPASAKATFVREDGEWKLQRLEIFQLRTNVPMRVPGID